jgi:hypothetical protein
MLPYVDNRRALRTHRAMFKDIHTHPFYRPLWRRVVIVASALVWAGFEVMHGASGLWMVLALGVFAFCAWTMLITYPKEP